MTSASKSIVKYDFLDFDENFQNIFFDHFFLGKACQYVTTNDKVCKKFRFIF
jgi:hypothetical protein